MAREKIIKTGSRLIIFVVFVLVFPVGLAGSIQAAELVPLKASYAAIGGVFTPVWVAQDNELFAKYGLAVDLKFMAPVIGTQALIGRSLDIVAPSGEFIEAGLSGEKVVYIAGIANRVVLSLYTKPEIRSLADLRGKVVSALSPGSTSDVLARILLKEADLILGRDVKMLYLKSGPEILTALTTGAIDAGVISAPNDAEGAPGGF